MYNKTVMDYENILVQIGEFGTYQKRLLAICLLPVIYTAFGSPISNFFFGDHLHRCKISDYPNDTYAIQSPYHADLINSSIPLKEDGSYDECHVNQNGTLQRCSEWVFDSSVFTRTVNSQFLLVCERKIILSHIMILYFFGVFTAVITLSPLADVIGRRMVCCLTLTLQFAMNIAEPFCTDIYVFAVLRFFDGMSGMAFYQTAFIIAAEMICSKLRQVAGTIILWMYCVGLFILAFLAYFIRDWRWLQLTIAVPMCVPLVYWWPSVLPESPRWLISRGRHEEALVILRKAAEVNKTKLDDNTSLVTVKLEQEEGMLTILKKLCRSRKLMVRLFIMTCNWFVISFIYYGIQINIGKFAGDLYFNFLMNVLAETAGYSFILVAEKCGRKPLYLGTIFSLGGICVTTIFLLLFLDKSVAWITVAVAMVGKCLVSLAFGLVFVYTSEMFPTVVRGTALAVSSFGARVGSLVTPYLYEIGSGRMRTTWPFILYSITVITVAIMSCALPETAHKRLTETMDDVNRSGKRPIADHKENSLMMIEDKNKECC